MNKCFIKSNRGSITVEMSLVMPMVLIIIFELIMMLVNMINQAVIQGNSYKSLYTFSAVENNLHEENLLQRVINLEMTLNKEGCQVDLVQKEDEVEINIISGGNVSSMRNIIYSSEEGKCTSRLRRWQLYEDVLQE